MDEKIIVESEEECEQWDPPPVSAALRFVSSMNEDAGNEDLNAAGA